MYLWRRIPDRAAERRPVRLDPADFDASEEYRQAYEAERSIAPPHAMRASIEHLDREYGGVRPYLMGAGVTEIERAGAAARRDGGVKGRDDRTATMRPGLDRLRPGLPVQLRRRRDVSDVPEDRYSIPLSPQLAKYRESVVGPLTVAQHQGFAGVFVVLDRIPYH